MITEILNSILGVLTPLVLMGAGAALTLKLGFLRLFSHGRIPKTLFRRPEKKGVSPFRAVTVALAGTLGVGNIVGVAGAITAGGFGAVFWMWVSALLAMVLKYSEITLAVAHRRRSGRENHGGAFCYILDFFAGKKRERLGRFVAALFCLFFLLEIFSTGCVVQINAAARAAQGVAGINPVIIGIAAAAVTVFAVSGGAESVSKITALLIPALSVGYIAMSLAVLLMRAGELPAAFRSIFSAAFGFREAAGGIFGFLTSRALRFGAMRGMLSNEAGCGTAPTAHAASNASDPAEQGVWGIFEVFVDTIVLCTMTAAVVIINYDAVEPLGGDGIMMAIRAYSAVLGGWAEYFLAAAVAVFGTATVVCSAHYGRECVRHLCSGRLAGPACGIFLLLYAAVTIVGTIVPPQSVWGLADLSLGFMTLINVTVVCAMSGEVRRHTDALIKRHTDAPVNRP